MGEGELDTAFELGVHSCVVMMGLYLFYFFLFGLVLVAIGMAFGCVV